MREGEGEKRLEEKWDDRVVQSDVVLQCWPRGSYGAGTALAWCGVVWDGTLWCGVAWYGEGKVLVLVGISCCSVCPFRVLAE